jgi:hypothetical protein
MNAWLGYWFRTWVYVAMLLKLSEVSSLRLLEVLHSHDPLLRIMLWSKVTGRGVDDYILARFLGQMFL